MFPGSLAKILFVVQLDSSWLSTVEVLDAGEGGRKGGKTEKDKGR